MFNALTGWQRLWIVITVIQTIAVSAYTYKTIPQKDQSNNYTKWSRDINYVLAAHHARKENPEAECKQQDIYCDIERSKLPQKISDSHDKEFWRLQRESSCESIDCILIKEYKISKLYDEKADVDLMSSTENIRKDHLENHTRKKWMSTTYVGVTLIQYLMVPNLLLILLFCTIRWVVQGFKEKGPKPLN